MTNQHNCRYCHKYGEVNGLTAMRYGVRHYAHPDCLLAAKREGVWPLLHVWQLDNFPYFAARRAGLVESLNEAIRSRRERT